MKTFNTLSRKTIALLSLMIYIISCIPVLYVGLFNYATGDDYLYGTPVKRALAENASMARILKIVIDDVIEEYNNFQATWASQFLWRFEPSIWGEKVYIVTIFISLCALNIGLFYFFWALLVRIFGLGKYEYVIASCWCLFYIIQYMDYPRGGLYWYTGMVQYTLAFGIALVGLGSAIRFLSEGKTRFLVGAILCMTYLGGGGYPEIVISLLGLSYCITWGILFGSEKRKRSLLLLIPLSLELIGFTISAIAPGNAMRGGEDYGLSVSRIITVFIRCFTDGTTGLLHSFVEVRPMVLLLIMMVAVGISGKVTIRIDIKMLLIAGIIGWFLVCMTRSPEIYAGSTVQAGFSGGVYNSYFFVNVLYIAIMAILIGAFCGKDINGLMLKEMLPGAVFSAAIVCWLLFGRHFIGNMLDYTIYKYVSSGQLADYEAQMQERFELLEDPAVTDVVVPYINNEQGPLMHMAVNEDVDGYTNGVTAGFYNKKSVKGIDRALWNEMYGK